MCAIRKIRTLMGAMLLVSGLAIANDNVSVAPNIVPPVQVTPAMVPSMVSPAPIWLQVLPVPGTQPYYPVPQPGMVWPPPPYPAPMTLPPATPPAIWMPFMWVLVPVQAPAKVDYGPVADTPVIELPLPDEVPAATTPEVAALVPVAAESNKTVIETDKPAGGGVAVDASRIELLPAAGMDGSSPAAVTSVTIAEPVAAPVNAMMVDYGPVMSTPVVDLLALQQQAAVASPRKLPRYAPKPVRKPIVATQPKLRSTTIANPAKKRLCWTNGVVAPCR